MAPLIGITATPELRPDGHPVEVVTRSFVASVHQAGGVPVVLPSLGPSEAGVVLDRLDGLLLSGGGDVVPARYGQELHPETAGIDNCRDDFECALIAEAERRDVPVLGVCRGAQILNVAKGGTLHQHLPDLLGDAGDHAARERIDEEVHPVAIVDGSLLAAVMGTHLVGVNTLHHQAIDELGEGLVVTASSEDGIIEAIESTEGHRVLGVQWHPELLTHLAPHAALFEWLVHEATHPRTRLPVAPMVASVDESSVDRSSVDERPIEESSVDERPVDEPEQSDPYGALNRYARIIVDEAVARGIGVRVGDPALGELELTWGRRRVATFESLSELTSAVAARRCDDKILTRRILTEAGLQVPVGRLATFDEVDVEFLRDQRDLVVKPVHGEQGWGVTVGVTDETALAAALDAARSVHPRVLLERRHDGHDLRVLVIGGEVVAAAVRTPPTLMGTGVDPISVLFERFARQRFAATGGAVRLELDEPTLATLVAAGHGIDTVPAAGEVVPLRRTANVHTGGSIDDVTADLHPDHAQAARRAADVIGAPVLGIDLIVGAVDAPGYVLIEANEQPGLANHDPQPTAERFIDLLFPATRRVPTSG